MSDHQPNPRQRFESNNLATASPARILTMCFDRLDRDLATAGSAIDAGDHPSAHDALTHAQDLLEEVAGMLDVNGWEHAKALLAVYDYLLRLLARANLLKQRPLVAEAQRLVTEIGDAFRTAATAVATPSANPAASAASVTSAASAAPAAFGAATATGRSFDQSPRPAGVAPVPAHGLSIQA